MAVTTASVLLAVFASLARTERDAKDELLVAEGRPAHRRRR
jgi:hypothetical protein